MAGEDLPGRAARLGTHALARLGELDAPLVRQVRGLGLLIGIELKVKVTPILQRLQERGVLALPAGSTVLRLLPPLVIEQTDLDRAIDIIAEVLTDTPRAEARHT
jgi:acetylornithine/LysW-gamma-L-lysine aminotransferase